MIEIIHDTIAPISAMTGLDIDIYTRIGERLASTHNSSDLYNFRIVERDLESAGGIVRDVAQNITYFAIAVKEVRYIGVITGANDTSANYAYMVARLLEASMSNQAPPPNRKEIFKMMLNGELTKNKLNSFRTKYDIKDVPYYVICVVVSAKNRLTALDFLEQMSGEGDVVISMPDNNIAMLKAADNEGDYQSAGEFAEMLKDNIEQDLSIGITVGIGGKAAELAELDKIYAQSVAAIRFGKMLDNKSRVFSHKDYMLVKLFEELPPDRLKWYVNSNLDKTARTVLADRELLDTAEQFFINDLNISETARVMYMHRNTLIYRLDKIEKTTGLNIRKFSDALIFRTLIVINKLSGTGDAD